MSSYCYRFEAKSIQSFLLATNKLKEIVGASELIFALCDGDNSLLDRVMAACELDEGNHIRFSRRAGGAFNAFFHDRAARDRFAALWSLAFAQHAPDLPCQIGIGEGDSDRQAFKNAEASLHASGNRATPPVPPGSPVAERHRRSGATAIRRRNKKNDQEPVDAATSRKLAFSRGGALARRFGDYPAKAWPTLLSPEKDSDRVEMPYSRDENRTLALIHADGNGLGQLLITLSERLAGTNHFVAAFRLFSDAVGRATEQAAREATRAVLEPAMSEQGVLPARPIILGGDDLTLLVRADLAPDFTETFLQAFETHTDSELKQVWQQFKAWGIDAKALPESLTACAGMAIVGASQPFHLADQLAGGLCKQAKDKVKKIKAANGNRVGSALSFHRVTTSFIADAQAVIDKELSFQAPNHKNNTAMTTYTQTLIAYGVGGTEGLPRFEDLKAMVDLFAGDSFKNGPARQVLGLVHEDRAQARIRYRRLREVMQKSESSEKALEQYDRLIKALLSPLGDMPEKDLPYVPKKRSDDEKEDGAHFLSPLGDLHALLALRSDRNSDNTQENAA